jgi:glycosyltransferase involved in cell wall biosynthesis
MEFVEVIVIDGLSTDGTDKIVKEYGNRVIEPKIILLTQPKRGPAAARNLGIKHSAGKLLVLIDADCYPTTSEWLQEICKNVTEEDQLIVHGRIQVPTNSFLQRFIRCLDQLGTRDYGNKSFVARKSSITFPTTNLVVTKKVFENIGMFDENLISGEDIDFCWRAHINGVTMKYVPSMTVVHTHRRSIFDLLNRAFAYAKHRHGLIEKYGVSKSLTLKDILSIIVSVTAIGMSVYFMFYSQCSLFFFITIVYLLILARFLRKSRRPEVLLYPFLYSCYIVLYAAGEIYSLMHACIGNVSICFRRMVLLLRRTLRN